MPQVWATFEEIATLYQIDVTSARNLVIENQWERRRCSDGVTRAILPSDAALKLMVDYAAQQPLPNRMSDHVIRAEGRSPCIDESCQARQMPEQPKPAHNCRAQTFPRATVTPPHRLHALGELKLTQAATRQHERPVVQEVPALRSLYAVVQARPYLMSPQLAA